MLQKKIVKSGKVFTVFQITLKWQAKSAMVQLKKERKSYWKRKEDDMMAPAETVPVKKETHVLKGIQNPCGRAITLATGAQIHDKKRKDAMTIQGPHKILIKKRVIRKRVSVIVSHQSVKNQCKFRDAVIVECQEAGMTADDIQKWMQEL